VDSHDYLLACILPFTTPEIDLQNVLLGLAVELIRASGPKRTAMRDTSPLIRTRLEGVLVSPGDNGRPALTGRSLRDHGTGVE